MTIKKRLSKELRAQAIAEVAIFGAIVLFLISAIVYQTMSISFSQEHSLKTLREAFRISMRDGSSANLLVVEDRLMPAVEKYGATERVPLISSAGVAFSQNLFMPKTYGVQRELPRMYIRINGIERVYKTAAWRTQSSCTEFFTKKAKDMECCSGISWIEEEGDPVKDKEIDEKEGTAASYDVDGDDTEEYIVGLKNGVCKLMDYNDGDLDPTDPDQGLQMELDFTTDVDASVTVEQPSNKFTRTKKVNNVICRYVNMQEVHNGVKTLKTDTICVERKR